jgi:hypothetical protein
MYQKVDMTIPTMRMGLIGFADEQYLRNLLMTRNRNLQWERWPFMEADALWVNGARAQHMRDSLVRVPSTDPAKKATVLNLKEMDRPAAFTLPLGDAAFRPPLAFDPHKAAEVAEVFNQFEAALLPTVVDLTLAAQIAQRRHELLSPTYHLSISGHLVAVVNVTGAIGIDATLTPHELMHADWSGVPGAAGEYPTHFRRASLPVVMWQYAMRNTGELLPSRYRRGTIYWRRMPTVPSRYIREEHLLVIAELSCGPQDIAQLVASTGLSETVVEQALAALYFGGSLTADPRKAGPTRAAKPRRPDESWPSSMTSAFATPARPVPPRPGRARADVPTVPTPLDAAKPD